MKLTKKIDIDGIETYFKDGVKKYEHYYSSDFGEWWSEYDKQGNEIHYKNSKGKEWWSEYNEQGDEIYRKDSTGDEWWSDKHPDKPKIKREEVDIEPFTFNKQNEIK